MLIDINEEAVATITLAELKSLRTYFTDELNDPDGSWVFHWDNLEEEREEINKHLNALEILIRWYDV